MSLLVLVFSKGGQKKGEFAAVVEELHNKYSGVLFDHCYRILNDRTEAEDALQDTFVCAFRSLSTFRYGDSHLPWLYRIATNTCLKVIRTKKRSKLELNDEIVDQAGETPNADAKLFARGVLERLVFELDERNQEILVHHYISGMDQGQIATCLGISRRAVVKRLRALRTRMGQMFEEEA